MNDRVVDRVHFVVRFPFIDPLSEKDQKALDEEVRKLVASMLEIDLSVIRIEPAPVEPIVLDDETRARLKAELLERNGLPADFKPEDMRDTPENRARNLADMDAFADSLAASVVSLPLPAPGPTGPTKIMADEKILPFLREEGWTVAVHNDYRDKGEPRTFWLFTHPEGVWAKGEGATDAIALRQVLEEALSRRNAIGRFQRLSNLWGHIDRLLKEGHPWIEVHELRDLARGSGMLEPIGPVCRACGIEVKKLEAFEGSVDGVRVLYCSPMCRAGIPTKGPTS